jgi:hypothetical protein
MVKNLPLSDLRAVRHKLEPPEFAISEGHDVAPTDLIDGGVLYSISEHKLLADPYISLEALKGRPSGSLSSIDGPFPYSGLYVL